MDIFIQQTINGLTLGAIYALIALGYTMVYGILELINFAHGEVVMVGAYSGILILGGLTFSGMAGSHPLLSLLVTFAGAMIICSLLGVLIERIAYRPLRKAHRLAPLISALGVSIILQNAVMLSLGSGNKVFPQIFPSGGVQMGGVNMSYLQIFIILTSILVMGGLTLFIRKSKLGMAMRATAQDHEAASLMGINPNFIISITFLIGSALAAVAGVMVAMYYSVAHYSMGYTIGLKAFTAAVLGGIGNIPGAMLGGFLLGGAESYASGFISSVYKDVIAFAILILVLVFRPSGLLGEQTPDKV